MFMCASAEIIGKPIFQAKGPTPQKTHSLHPVQEILKKLKHNIEK